MDTSPVQSDSLPNGTVLNGKDLDDFVLQLDFRSDEGSFINGETNSSCKMASNKDEVPGLSEKDNLKLGIEIQDVIKNEEEHRQSNHDRLSVTDIENIRSPVVKTEHTVEDDEIQVLILKNSKLNRSICSEAVDNVLQLDDNEIYVKSSNGVDDKIGSNIVNSCLNDKNDVIDDESYDIDDKNDNSIIEKIDTFIDGNSKNCSGNKIYDINDKIDDSIANESHIVDDRSNSEINNSIVGQSYNSFNGKSTNGIYNISGNIVDDTSNCGIDNEISNSIIDKSSNDIDDESGNSIDDRSNYAIDEKNNIPVTETRNELNEINSMPNNNIPSEATASIPNGIPDVQMDVVSGKPPITTADDVKEIKIKVEDKNCQLPFSEITVENCVLIKKERHDNFIVTDSHLKKPKIEEHYSDLQMMVCSEEATSQVSEHSFNSNSMDCDDISENSNGNNFDKCKGPRKRKSQDNTEDIDDISVTDSSLNSSKKVKLSKEIRPALANGFVESNALGCEDLKLVKKLKPSNDALNEENNAIVNSIEDEVVNIIKKKKPMDKNERMQARLQIFNSFYSSDNTITVNRDILEEMILKKVAEYLSFSSEVAILRQRCKVLQNEEVRMLKTVNALKKQLEDAKHIIKKLIDEKMSGQPWTHGVAPLRVTRSVGLQVCSVGSVNVISTKSKEKESLKVLRKRDSARSPKIVVPSQQTPTSTSADANNSSLSSNNAYNSPRNDSVRTEDSIASTNQVNTPKVAVRNDLSALIPKPMVVPTLPPVVASPLNVSKHENISQKRESFFNNKTEKRSNPNLQATDLIDLTDDSPAVTSSTDVCLMNQQKDLRLSQARKHNISMPPKTQKDLLYPLPMQEIVTSHLPMQSKQKKELYPLPKQPKDLFPLPKQQKDLLPLPKQQTDAAYPLSKARLDGIFQPKQNHTPIPPKLSTGLCNIEKPGTMNTNNKSPTSSTTVSIEHLPKFPLSPKYPPEVIKPPKPILKIGKNSNNKASDKEGIMLSWSFEAGVDISSIKEYQLYAFQENKFPLGEKNEKAEKHENWKKVGDIKALPLPMACFLTQFVEGHKYHFIVRAVDCEKRLGDFSLPGSILLHTKSSLTPTVTSKAPLPSTT